MGVLANGMILLNIQKYVQWGVKDAVLLAHVAVDQFVAISMGLRPRSTAMCV
jgi:ABC-type xylose transport system permease subunit